MLRVGVAGLGVVGSAFAIRLTRDGADLAARAGQAMRLVAVSARDKTRARGFALDAVRWEDDPQALARADDIDVVAEFIGGDEGPARACVEAALEGGRHVITANKALIAAHGAALAALAEKRGAGLAYEASVGGGMPIVAALRDGVGASPMRGIWGVLNGTCNYVLDRVERDGISQAEALAEAQRLGYAEADASFDMGGHDSMHKIKILAALAFGLAPEAIRHPPPEGIAGVATIDARLAGAMGLRPRLLACALAAEGDDVAVRVFPALVDAGSFLGEPRGADNVVLLQGAGVDVRLFGPGAGGAPTAEAALGDLVSLARYGARPAFGRPALGLRHGVGSPPGSRRARLYVRAWLRDLPGELARLTSMLAEEGFSVTRALQPGEREGDRSVAALLSDTMETETLAGVRRGLETLGYAPPLSLALRVEALL